jgi:glycosyltransferase involved in cell wall biosynthesis
MIKFSIITVCLNSEKTIKRCLDSISSQKFRNFEHIIVDGLSKDSTLDIISEYDVAVCISEKDYGIYDAMNKGVSLSKGKYVLFLNSDDELLPDFLLECDRVIDDADFLSSSINMVFPDRITTWTSKKISNVNFIWRMPMPHAGLIVKKNVYNEIGGFDLSFKITSDFDFVVKLLKGHYKGVYNVNSFFNFYMGGVSQSYNGIKENHKVHLKHFNNYILIYLAYFLDNLRYLKSKF